MAWKQLFFRDLGSTLFKYYNSEYRHCDRHKTAMAYSHSFEKWKMLAICDGQHNIDSTILN